ncbi:C-terminal binding protein [Aliiroseovarius crassostreae]|uniref:C-terminal binding protein n=1 Tax=Aliiroseovarius crassostreae TaxID=154981 RepID=UPI0022085B9E|nr:C-terminal binding protein [Aliiroseovarius crassostreae]UWP92338.1 C-terminal binding protein [Aliiroseovarius crassostreae]
MKIVRTDCELQTPLVDKALTDAGHRLVLLPDGISEEDLIAEIRDADLLLMCYTPITRKVIASAPKLRGIVKYGVGIDAIDIPAANEHGVTVVNIPEYAEETVAEGAFALLIALAKKLPALNDHMHKEGWAWPEPTWLGTDIAGKTLGIIGLGKIGRSMARMAGQGFRARVIAYSPHTPEEEMQAMGVEKCDTLDALLTESDFISIHSVLNEETRHLIGERELRLMKPSAILINAARGAIIDEDALVRAMCEGWIAGLGLDVFSREPLSLADHPMSALFSLPNVILSPHLTFYTKDAMERLERETLERCQELIEGREVLVKSTDPRLRIQTKGVTFKG